METAQSGQLTQYNSKITEELKSKLEDALKESGAENKSDFLAQMLEVFENHRVDKIESDVDLSKYELINNETKQSVLSALKHVLSALESNYSNLKQEKILTSDKRKEFEELEEKLEFKYEKLLSEMNSLKLEFEDERKDINRHHAEKIEKIRNENTTLQVEVKKCSIENKKLLVEVVSLTKISEQIEFITDRNKQLILNAEKVNSEHKEEINEFKKGKLSYERDLECQVDEIQEKDKDIYKKDLQLKQESLNGSKQQDDIRKLELELKELQAENTKILSKYNNTMGKLEMMQENAKKTGES